ncbi:hypothetical protein [Telmatospirillum siberiense]|uniref:Uncharacterized protein n=1 Tax=Telmatospirillum siberiense TaxID=382514 RepID=A0A2N3PNP0_9PROT|nr:hypothetical protein [Telmatospirillum siberiense]PKU22000.1 hypothetical protein CWS72_24150 [Telmatospirillum siberiense]
MPSTTDSVSTLSTKELEGLKADVASLKGSIENLSHSLSTETAAREAAERRADTSAAATSPSHASQPAKTARPTVTSAKQPKSPSQSAGSRAAERKHARNQIQATRIGRHGNTGPMPPPLTLLSAMPGEAVVDQRGAMLTLHEGDAIEGWGKVTAIGQSASGSWVVTTARGIAAQEQGR